VLVEFGDDLLGGEGDLGHFSISSFWFRVSGFESLIVADGTTESQGHRETHRDDGLEPQQHEGDGMSTDYTDFTDSFCELVVCGWDCGLGMDGICGNEKARVLAGFGEFLLGLVRLDDHSGFARSAMPQATAGRHGEDLGSWFGTVRIELRSNMGGTPMPRYNCGVDCSGRNTPWRRFLSG
jgi:hypothetical protein